MRADINHDGGVGLADVGRITGQWGSPGYIQPWPVTKVIYVHGLSNGAEDPAPGRRFFELLGPIRNEAINRGISYESFTYIQDAACATWTVYGPWADSNISTAISWAQFSANICDSQSDIGLNAVALWQEVVDSYNATGGKTILIGYSMGASIIRGMLTYSLNRRDHGPADPKGDRVATDLVDSVFYIEGAQSGASLVSDCIDGSTIPIIGVAAGLVCSAIMPGFDPDRAAIVGLDDGSAWWAFANGRPPASIPTFNAYGDIQVTMINNLGQTFPVGGVGDLGLSVSDAQHPMPITDANHRQYTLSSPELVSQTCLGAVGCLYIQLLSGNPVVHSNLPYQISQVQVAHCGTGPEWSLAQEYANLVYRRIAHPGQGTCSLDDMTDITD